MEHGTQKIYEIAYPEILGQPDEEYFEFIKDTDARVKINRACGIVWDYSPRLWDVYTSIDEYFRHVSDKVKLEPEYRKKIYSRARKIKYILGR